jgi:hypothetical protein
MVMRKVCGDVQVRKRACAHGQALGSRRKEGIAVFALDKPPCLRRCTSWRLPKHASA